MPDEGEHRRAREQREAVAPRRDMDHVDGDHGRRGRDRPFGVADVEQEGRAEVGRAACRGVGRDAGEEVGVAVGRLPHDAGQAAREVGGMLAGAAGDLEDEPGGREHPPERGQDRIPVPPRGRKMQPGAGPRRRRHSSAPSAQAGDFTARAIGIIMTNVLGVAISVFRA